MSIFLIILFSIPLLSLAWWVWTDRRLKSLNAGRGWRVVVGAGVLSLLAGFIWVLLARRGTVDLTVPAPLYAALLLWALLFLPLLGLPTMVIWSLGSIARRVVRGSEKKEPAGPDLTRREWLGAAAISLPVVATAGTTLFSLPQMKRFRVREITVTLANLPAALDGIQIAHLTDTHVGKFTRGKVLDEIVETTNRLKADLVLFTGDLIDNTIRDLPEAVKLMQRLQADSGVYLVEGNHDLIDNPKKFRTDVLASGLNLLLNQAVTVEVRGVPVQILGIRWGRSDEQIADDVDQVAALRDPDAFPILLAHHPHAFERAAERGIPLTLAGHTHGGQLMLSEKLGAGPAMFRYWSGLYRDHGHALVVGNGTGNWFPLRVNAPAEIIHLTLRKG